MITKTALRPDVLGIGGWILTLFNPSLSLKEDVVYTFARRARLFD
ncbi:MAG TPA: hypothetical protein P5568_09450 [Acidobacteriota bacterium]|nr:hypothetical protein [Acidobacteriota bacterium]HRR57036.1 hypothetical protein [Acidobacteriota bacterium]HRV08678.1 hypothetical protein [Acidobacteriota bacterium]